MNRKIRLEAASPNPPPGLMELLADLGDGENGFTVSPRDPARMADCIQVLLGDSDLRSRMGAAGRRKVLAGFSDELVVNQTLDCYRELVSDRWPTETERIRPSTRMPAGASRL